MAKIRILIADDHSIVREGARQLIAAQPDMTVVGESERGNDALQRARELRPDIVVLDISMPDLNGLDLLVLLRRASPTSKVVILSVHQEPMLVRQALVGGAQGYVVKTAPVNELLEAIRSVNRCRTFISPQIDSARLGEIDTTLADTPAVNPYDLLTEREQQVFRLVVQGRTSQQIAELLCLSARTVEKHRAAMMHKLGVKDAFELVKCAVRLGVISAED